MKLNLHLVVNAFSYRKCYYRKNYFNKCLKIKHNDIWFMENIKVSHTAQGLYKNKEVFTS